MRAITTSFGPGRWPLGHHNPHNNLVIRYNRRDYELRWGGGNTDDSFAYREGKVVYILTFNRRYGYYGLDAFDLEAAPLNDAGAEVIFPFREVFCQTDMEYHVPHWQDLSPAYLIRLIRQRESIE